MKLDTPEAIEQWIAERKKRFPTAEKIAEKRKKLEEAAARGQLPLEEDRFARNKRRRLDTGLDATSRGRGSTHNQRSRGRGRGRGRGQGRDVRASRDAPADQTDSTTARENSDKMLHDQPGTTLEPQALPVDTEDVNDDASLSSDSDAPPEVVSSKTAPKQTEEVPHLQGAEPKPLKKPQPRQPKRQAHNPFNSRPALLRNVRYSLVLCKRVR